jgi:hypothetical protein
MAPARPLLSPSLCKKLSTTEKTPRNDNERLIIELDFSNVLAQASMKYFRDVQSHVLRVTAYSHANTPV